MAQPDTLGQALASLLPASPPWALAERSLTWL